MTFRPIPRVLTVLTGFLLSSLVITPPCHAGDDSLANKLKKANLRVLPAKGDKAEAIQRLLADDAREQLFQANRRETRAWHKIKSKAGWESYRKQRVQALRKSLGTYPPVPKNLHIKTTRQLKGDGYIIKNIVFESRPGLLVTANLYLPAKEVKSMPGILICHSHHNPKTQGELQDMGMNWARQGCAVLIMDQLGHGERRQHPFQSAKSYPKSFRVSRQDYYYRYDDGLQLYLIGNSLMSWMAWDIMRGVDVVLTLPNIDSNRIILLGAVAGGGDPCAVTAALDDRIAAAVPFNFGGPQPENRYPLPENAEDRFNYAGSGSWESTRNLRYSARDGFLPWVIVGGIAPRRLVYGHEFAWDKKHDPVWARLQQIYKWYSHPDYLSSSNGRGSVRGRPPTSTHCNNIGPVHRKQIYPAFKKWFNIAIPEPEYQKRRDSDELLCLTAKIQQQGKKVHQLAHQIAAKQIARARAQQAKLSPKERSKLLKKTWSKLLGGGARPKAKVKQNSKTTMGDVIVQQIVLNTERGILVPMVLLQSATKSKQKRPVVVAIAQQGKEGFLKHRDATIAALLKKNIAVCLPDLRATGEVAPGKDRGRNSWITAISATELMLGDTIRGGQCRDLLAVLGYLRKQPGLDGKNIALWGDSFAAVNAPDRNLIVPRGIDDFPAQCEPMGPTVALLTALFDGHICAVSIRGGLTSYLSILDLPVCLVPHDEVIPGVFAAGDLADLAAALAPMPLRMEAMVNGQNQRATGKQLQASMAPARQRYQQTGHGSALLRLSASAAPADTLATWYAHQLSHRK